MKYLQGLQSNAHHRWSYRTRRYLGSHSFRHTRLSPVGDDPVRHLHDHRRVTRGKNGKRILCMGLAWKILPSATTVIHRAINFLLVWNTEGCLVAVSTASLRRADEDPAHGLR